MESVGGKKSRKLVSIYVFDSPINKYSKAHIKDLYCHFLLLSFWFLQCHPRESPWHSAPLSAGVSGGEVKKLPATCRGRRRAAKSSLRREPPGWIWRSRVRRQKWRGLFPWEQRHWQDPREQLGSRVPAQREGWNGSKLRYSPAGLCWRRCPAGC